MAFYSRKSTRIPNFDYSCENYYFVTICTHEKECLFANQNQLNEFGRIAQEDMRSLASHYNYVVVDNFIVMPNHVHAIIQIHGSRQKKNDLNMIVGSYKAGVSRKIHKLQPDLMIWQRSFHDHVIRNQQEYEKIWQYIQFNWQKWEQDCFYSKNTNDER